MKYAVLLLVVMAFGFKPPRTCDTKATITEFSGLKRMCAWGWVVEIDGKEYIAPKLPGLTHSGNDSITYPITIYINYTINERCANNINVSCLSFPEN
jgi:hypothetical protein